MVDYVTLQGKLSWVRHTKPDEKYNKWSLKLHPTPESLEKIRELQTASNGVSGMKNVLGKDEDGYYMSFSRPTSKLYNGQVRAYTPPVVINPDGSPFGDKAIGNGSDGTIQIEVYTHKTPGGGKARACRWEKLRVDNHVPFAMEKDLSDQEFAKVESIAKAPPQLF